MVPRGGADGGDDSDGEMIGPTVNVAAAGPGDGPTPHLVSFVFRSVAVPLLARGD